MGSTADWTSTVAKGFLLIRAVDGQPDIPQAILDDGPVNWVLCDIKGDSPPVGAYLMAARGAQLVALDALPYCLGIVAVTESDNVRWPELDGEAAQDVINRLNTWLTNNGFGVQVPSGWTYARLVRELFQWFNERFDLRSFDVIDVA